jgi:biopolymer transport protein ExbD
MKETRRMKRMARSQKRAKSSGFNLTSLMDIFTILVFFLLVNSSNTQDLPSPDKIQLPQSVSESRPEETTVVMVTDTDILVQGTKVTTVQEVLDAKGITIPAIAEELVRVSSRAVGISAKSKQATKDVTIMGDKKIPFKLLKKIMSSCTQAGYETIYLAVVQKASQFKGESPKS